MGTINKQLHIEIEIEIEIEWHLAHGNRDVKLGYARAEATSIIAQLPFTVCGSFFILGWHARNSYSFFIPLKIMDR